VDANHQLAPVEGVKRVQELDWWIRGGLARDRHAVVPRLDPESVAREGLDLGSVVDRPARGDALIAPNVTARLLSTFARMTTPEVLDQPVHPLTEREEEVLRAVARGLPNQEIAGELYMSLSTVKTHVSSRWGSSGTEPPRAGDLGIRDRADVTRRVDRATAGRCPTTHPSDVAIASLSCTGLAFA
jgi:DNA-binding CsgD family transcriptional regulator